MEEALRITAGEPSIQERNSYFHGLPSRPKLVARSNIEVKFKPGNGGIWWPITKSLSPASPNHKIASLWVWDSPLQRDIFNALSGIDWKAIDVLRIGLDPNPECPEVPVPGRPHVLLVSVKPDSTTWQQAYPAVMSCRRILQQHGIDDIHCEMKESPVSRAYDPSVLEEEEPDPAAESSLPVPNAAPPTAPKLISQSQGVRDGDLNMNHRTMASECLGGTIASYLHPRRQGGKGLYLRRMDTGAILMLTCRHVVFKEEEPKTYQHSLELQSPRPVIQPGSGTHRKMLDFINSNIKTLDGRTGRLQNNFDLPEERQKALITTCNEEQVSSNMWKDYLISIKDVETRIIGHVLFSPEYGCGICPSGSVRLRNWALVELHPDKHQTDIRDLKNVVALSLTDLRAITVAAATEIHKYDYSLFDLEGLLQLEGIVHEDEIRRPRTMSKNKEPVMVVAMFGPSSERSIGLSNSIMSVTRSVVNGRVEKSEEWCILCRKEVYGRDKGYFSEPDDLASCVWDTSGRVAGILSAGNGAGIHDVTYATPIEWLLHDIRTQSGIDVELA
ncbi:unnamed protein product [Clonostachys rosea]|uniref:Uncharacterized protein n=1 Tax=Bionectria ochroleuca TaxID=29856 RepID=A0ABY6USX4_BIOOC|nr:unnamed protein product [Clonostachys rosea]